MVKDLAKSMFRFSWAMGMLGVDQAAQLVGPSRDIRKSKETLDAISETAAAQMGSDWKQVYQAGEHFQSGMIDTVSRWTQDSWEDPAQAMNNAWEDLDRSFTNLRSDLKGAGSQATEGSEDHASQAGQAADESHGDEH